jgi:hypothetical protein
LERLRARIVAKGYAQRPGLDYNETFSPVARATSVRALISIAVALEYKMTHLDVATAFLFAPVEEDIYVEQPEGFVSQKESDRNKVYKLHMSLYGIKQAPRQWHEVFEKTLMPLGLTPTQADPCVYTHTDPRDPSKRCYLALYVDDCYVFYNDEVYYNNLLKQLQQIYKMTDLGQLRWFLGIELTPTPNGCILNQSQLIDKMVEQLGLQAANPAPTPTVVGQTMSKEVKEEDRKTDFNYPQFVGQLIYLLHTRPDL